jgi:hypothetical protein
LAEKEPKADHLHWGAAPSAKSTVGLPASLNNKSRKESLDRSTIETYFGIIGGLGYSAMTAFGFPVNFWLGLLLWLGVAFCLIDLAWRSPVMIERRLPLKILATLVVVIFSAVVLTKGWDNTHPTASTNGSLSTGAKVALKPPTEQPANSVEQKTDQIPQKNNSASKLLSSNKPPKKTTTPSNDNRGSVGGSITQGPCSNLQIGGSNNQATANCGNVRSLTQEEKTQLVENLRQAPPGVATVWAVDSGQKLGMDIYDSFRAAGWQMQEPKIQIMFITEPTIEDIDVFVHGEPGDTGPLSTSDPTTVTLMHSLAALKRFKSGGLGRSEKVSKGVIKVVVGPPLS